ncbi:MAG: dihydrodipicolinate synthase family protein [Caldilineaceae bacterium]
MPCCSRPSTSAPTAAIIDHYRLIAEAADGTPTHVYNIPSATGVEINADLMRDLLRSQVYRDQVSGLQLYDMQRIVHLRPDVTVLWALTRCSWRSWARTAPSAAPTT